MDVIHLRDVAKTQINSRCLQWLVADNGPLQSDLCSCCIVEILPGASAKPPHSHTDVEEAIYVLDGRGEMCSAEGRSYPVEAGTFLLMRRHEIHMLNNNGDVNLKAICFYSSNTNVEKYTLHPMRAVGVEE